MMKYPIGVQDFEKLIDEGYTEKCQSQGRVDCVMECPNDIYIIEFKLN